MEPFEIFISGYAKLPAGTTAAEMYKVVAVGLLIDKHTGRIIDADCSLITRVAKEFVSKHLVGKNLLKLDEIEAVIQNHYFGSVKKALISSMRRCHDKYLSLLEANETEE